MFSKSFWNRVYRFLRSRYAPRGARLSFAGSGEDLIIADLLKGKETGKITYIDIGAYHPVYGNNTYLLYRNGGRGVLVEPNKEMCTRIKKVRPHDTCLNKGVGPVDGEANFYSFSRDTRSTFSKEEALAWERSSAEKPMVSMVPTISLDTLIRDHFNGRVVDLVSIDTEGYEVEILKDFSWEKRPKIFCVEIVSSSGIENQAVYKLLDDKGYELAARTPVNAIFIDKK